MLGVSRWGGGLGMKRMCSIKDLDLMWRLGGGLGVVIALSCLLVSGCRHESGAWHPDVDPLPKKLILAARESGVLQNLIQVSDRVYSGGEPHGEEAFLQLSEMGIRTVISVDGARPDLERANKQGLRYIHVPIGYDGIEKEAALSIVHAMRETTGKVYIHCHHGRHRGPVAAAIACMADGRMGPEEGCRILEVAGTSRDYAGLWRDVETFRPPDADAVLPELVEAAQVGDLAESMAKMDRVFDRLLLLEANQWKAPDSHADLDAGQEALILRELLHESTRLLGADASGDLQKRFDQAELEVVVLQDALEDRQLERATTKLKQIKTTCKSCHQHYRNEPTR